MAQRKQDNTIKLKITKQPDKMFKWRENENQTNDLKRKKNEVNAFYSLNLRRISGATCNSLE